MSSQERRLSVIEAALAREGLIERTLNAYSLVAAELREVGCTVLHDRGIVVVDEGCDPDPAVAAARDARLTALAGRGPPLSLVEVVIIRRLEPFEKSGVWSPAFLHTDPPLMVEDAEAVAHGTVEALANGSSARAPSSTQGSNGDEE